jgi:hypothetical protein
MWGRVIVAPLQSTDLRFAKETRARVESRAEKPIDWADAKRKLPQ